MPWKLHIEKVNDSIAMKRTNDNGTTYTAVTYHHISAVRSIVPDGALNFAPRQADNNRKFSYPYTNKWRITINFTSENGTVEVFDTQDVINQAGWVNTAAGFNQALLDINSWLVPA